MKVGQTIEIITPGLQCADVVPGEILEIVRVASSSIDVVNRKTKSEWSFDMDQLGVGFLSKEILMGNSTPSATGVKHDNEKVPLDLLSPIALLATAKVMAVGAKKYSAHNWRGGFKWSRLIGACMRHLLAYMAGEDLDPETGLPHIDHLACEVMFLQEFYRTKTNLDDRYTTDKEAIKDLMPIQAQNGVSQKTEQ